MYEKQSVSLDLPQLTHTGEEKGAETANAATVNPTQQQNTLL
jgi:hypothetical protein